MPGPGALRTGPRRCPGAVRCERPSCSRFVTVSLPQCRGAALSPTVVASESAEAEAGTAGYPASGLAPIGAACSLHVRIMMRRLCHYRIRIEAAGLEAT